MAEAYERDPGALVSDKTSSAELRYIVLRAGDNQTAAYTAIRNYAPAEFEHPEAGTIPISGIELEPYSGNGIWYGSAKYSSDQGEQAPSEAGTGTTPENAPQPPENSADIGGGITFTTVGQTQHITTSRETRQRVAVAGNAPDCKQAIGVDQEAQTIEGCDIVIPKMEITIKRKLGLISPAYLQVLRDLTGTTNSAKFFRFERGEVLFLGASGTLGKDGWDVDFQFSVIKNEATVDCGNGLTLTNKRGHDWVWVSMRPAVNQDVLTKQPQFAYLERVYAEADFARLGLFANG